MKKFAKWIAIGLLCLCIAVPAAQAYYEPILQQSYDDGYKAGYAQGKTKGDSDGLAAGKRSVSTQTNTSPSYNTSDSQSSTSNSYTVYITDTGSKYHRSGCSYLKSKHAISKADAVAAGYTPCSRCKP